MEFKITSSEAIYTGGNIYCFKGSLSNEDFFLADDTPSFRVLNADPRSPENEEDSWFSNWQESHLVRDISEDTELLQVMVSLYSLILADDDYYWAWDDIKIRLIDLLQEGENQ